MIKKKFTKQIMCWSGEFGKAYTNRNLLTLKEMNEMYKKRYGISRTEMNKKFINNFPVSSKILEVGANTGNQLLYLNNLGFKHLYGIELQKYAIEIAKAPQKGIVLIQASAFGLPFKDESFDLIFTSGFLIHISPEDIINILKEIYRCTRKYIWGFEYFSEKYVEVKYRGFDKLLWKTNFMELYLNNFPKLRFLKETRFRYLENDNIDTMFLLEKM